METVSPTVILLILTHILVPGIAALRCYTCGGDGKESCDNFTVTDSKFIKECQAETKSCRFERSVKTNRFLNRSCATWYLSDCKEANDIEFCYCTKDLCNFLSPFGDSEEGDSFSDDIFEGSGLETTTIHTRITTIENLLPKSLCSICQFSDLLLSLSALLLTYLFIP